MARLVWTEPALSDLNDIAEYISLENPRAASTLVRRVFSTVERLIRHPKSGRIPEELEGARYREVLVGPCRVFYRVVEDRVFILYVMRSERQLRNFILEDRGGDDS